MTVTSTAARAAYAAGRDALAAGMRASTNPYSTLPRSGPALVLRPPADPDTRTLAVLWRRGYVAARAERMRARRV